MIPFGSILREMRPHQWIKNILVFLPILMAHQLGDLRRWREACCAFGAFCLASSSVYVINDLLDLKADRHHPVKCRRPFASGELPAWWGAVLECVLLAGAAGLTWLSGSGGLAAVLAAYLVLANAYSVWLKHEMLLDVVVLAGLYTSRIVAGGAAEDIRISTWLLGFSTFLFFSMALVKRVSELDRHTRVNSGIPRVRGYLLEDVETLTMVGIAAGCLAALVIVLYMTGSEVVELYPRSNLLWTISPVFLYWMSRLWVKARRGEVQEDPLLFCARDKITYLVGLLVGIILLLASGYPA